MEAKDLREMSCLVEETVESLEGAAAALESIMRESGLTPALRARLFATRDVLCVCAGRIDVISDFLDGEDGMF